MPTIVLDRLPYLPDPQLPRGLAPPSAVINLSGQAVHIKKYQIIVWASLAYQGVRSLPANASRFPAVLDTGTTHDLILREQHLRDWAGVDPKRYKPVGAIALDIGTGTGISLEVLPYNVWLYRNRPFERDQLTAPFCLHVGGVAYCPSGGIPVTGSAGVSVILGPRLPVLGLRAFRLARMTLAVDAGQNLVALSAP